MSKELVKAITELEEERVEEITDELLKGGTDPLEILNDCKEAMVIIGERFEKGESFIPELIMAGEMLDKISEKIKPVLQEKGSEQERHGTVVIGTVEGDIHDIAKDIVAFMLDVNGFKVIDLGVDVPPSKFVDSAKENNAQVVGLSGFLTLAYDPMKKTVEEFGKQGMRDSIKVMIGGGQVDEQVREFTGADAFGKDAMSAVALAKKWVGVK